MTNVLTLILVGITLTSYRPVKNQTDDTPYHTSTSDKVHASGIAVSRDMLCPMSLSKDLRIKKHSSLTCNIPRIHYGDVLYIEGYGFKIVNDCMNKRHKRAVDIFVWTHAEERKIGTRKGITIRRVYAKRTSCNPSENRRGLCRQ